VENLVGEAAEKKTKSQVTQLRSAGFTKELKSAGYTIGEDGSISRSDGKELGKEDEAYFDKLSAVAKLEADASTISNL
jgi:hypothetical protein